MFFSTTTAFFLGVVAGGVIAVVLGAGLDAFRPDREQQMRTALWLILDDARKGMYRNDAGALKRITASARQALREG